MKPYIPIILTILSLCLLNACTGSQEARPSTLLVVGYGSDQLGIFATSDLFKTNQEAKPQFLVSRTLQGKAQALDVVDRSNRRSQTAILVAKNAAYWLELYNLATIDPVDFDPNNMFTAVRSPIALELDQLAIDPSVSDKPLAICPRNLQVSRQGRYVAFINDKNLCSDKLSSTGLIVLDIEASPAKIVYHRNSSIFPKAFYIEQAGDQLFFFSEQAGGAQLEQLNLNSLPSAKATALLTLKGNDTPTTLLSLMPYESSLLVLRSSDYSIVEKVFASEAAKEGDKISSNSGAEHFIINDFDFRSRVYIANGTRLTVHNRAKDDDESSYSITTSVASFDFANSLIYFLSNKNVGIFDALSQQVSPSINLEILDSPTVATVIQGVVRNRGN